jgi:hypothetical protein
VTGLSSGVTAVSTDYYSSCAAVSGGVWCWGNNANDQLGNGTAAADSLVPVQLSGFTGSVTGVSVGNTFACALTTGGGVECWGSNADGQLGDNSTTKSAAPVQVMNLASGVTAISAGGNYACAIVSGAVECWGDNGLGQSLVPVAIAGLASGATGVAVGADPFTLPTNACAVVNGGVMCWGDNSEGQLGNNSTTSSSVPVPVATLTTGVVAVSVGTYYACAITADGGVWCWGDNASGSVPLHVTGFPQ